MNQPEPPTIEIGPESETARGWAYEITVARAGMPERTIEMRLSWADYDHWCGGDERPSEIARRVLSAALSIEPDLDLPDRLDASTLRRRVRGLEGSLRGGG